MAKNRSKRLITAEDRETFAQYIDEMSTSLEYFVTGAGKAGFPLDYSLDSLDNLENLLLSDARVGHEVEIDNRAARYLGEVFRRSVGGNWELVTEPPNHLWFNLPVISGYAKMPLRFAPTEMIANFIHNKERGFLKRVVNSHLEFKK